MITLSSLILFATGERMEDFWKSNVLHDGDVLRALSLLSARGIQVLSMQQALFWSMAGLEEV